MEGNMAICIWERLTMTGAGEVRVQKNKYVSLMDPSLFYPSILLVSFRYRVTDRLSRTFVETRIRSIERVYQCPRHQRHKDNPEKLEPIFCALSRPFSDRPHGAIAELARVLGIKRSILSTWRDTLQSKPHCRTSRKAYTDTKRILTDRDEWE